MKVSQLLTNLIAKFESASNIGICQFLMKCHFVRI